MTLCPERTPETEYMITGRAKTATSLTRGGTGGYGYINVTCPSQEEGPMPLRIELDQGEDYWRLTLEGELDYGECAGFRMNIDRILNAAPPATVVDLSKLDYMDSSGLGLLLSLSKEYTAQGGRLVLITNETVDNILQLTRLTGIFSVAGNDSEAHELIADTRA
jgi:anti-sigma B factor antagonist